MHKGPEPRRMPKHVDKAHLAMMRYASAQARRRGSNREQTAPPQLDRVARDVPIGHPHHTHVISSIQRGLEAIGFGGAAHPIRRLHHLGGEEAFPLGGKGPGALGSVGRKIVDVARNYPEKTAAETFGKSVGVGLTAGAAGLLGYEFMPKYGGLARDLRRLGPPAPTTTTLPSKPYSQAGQNATNARLMSGWETDIRRLLSDGTITAAQAQDSIRWGRNQASSANGTLVVRQVRQHLHDTFKPPKAGWAPHVGN